MSGSTPTDVRRLSLIAIVFLVVLRISIGWQFFYEGIWKLNTYQGKEPWTAAGYLKNAKGPFRTTFRNMVDDPYDFEKLDQAKMTERWTAWKEGFQKHYGLNEEQTKSLDDLVAKSLVELKKTLENPDWVGKPALKVVGEIEDYRGKVDRYEARVKLAEVDFQEKHLDDQWSKLEEKRKMLSGPVDALTKDLQSDAQDLLTVEQINQYGKAPRIPTKLDSVNQQTIWALTILGFCMMVGLFSRTAALGTAVMLTMFYLVVPPWPGVPEAPGPEHSLIVNKNFIEMIACLAIAVMPTGRWLGLDALIHRFILRGKTD